MLDLGNPITVKGVDVTAEVVRSIEIRLASAKGAVKASDVRRWLAELALSGPPVGEPAGDLAEFFDRAADRILQRLRKAGRIRKYGPKGWKGPKGWVWCDNQPMSLPRIVCAAIFNDETGVMLVGPRHFDGVMRNQINSIGYAWTKRSRKRQGFIDQFGNFWDRQQAWKIAEARGQIRQVSGTKGTLYSEDLY